MSGELIERLRASYLRTLTDPQRLLWREDVEGICPTPGVCWEYGDTARCGPCAIKQAAQHSVESDLSVPNLPEVYRLRREIARLRAELSALRETDADVIARLVGALEDIAHWTPRPFEMPADWSEQINACADCQRYSGHPIQRGICDTHRRPLWDREKHAKHQDVLRGLDAQQIASAALTDTAAQRQSVSPQGDGGLAQ